jgi:hypothetical protein
VLLLRRHKKRKFEYSDEEAPIETEPHENVGEECEDAEISPEEMPTAAAESPSSARNDQRYHRVCPVPGCRSKPQKKLSQHLCYKHPYLTPKQRQRFLQVARRIGRPQSQLPHIRHGHDLHQILCTACEEEPAVPEDVIEASENEEEGTRHFPLCDMCDLMFVSFGKYLRGIDGGQRSEKTAGEIAKDVSKYLKYACGGEEVDWMTLTERDRLLGYVDKLKRVKVGPDGQLGKLDALSCALRFIKVSLPHDASPALFSKIAAAEAALGGWKDKRRLRKVRLQKLSEESLRKTIILLYRIGSSDLPLSNSCMPLCITCSSVLRLYTSPQL